MGFPLYKYVEGGVKGHCRNVFHERSVCGFLEQYLNSSYRLVMFSGDMYPREPISNEITFTFALVISGMKWEYLYS